MKKVGLYVRVSTQEQKMHGISIENQLDALRKYCQENGYFITAIYNDAGISAHVSYQKRPALLQMIQDCQSEKIDLLLFTRLDRFFRSVKDYYLVISQMSKVPWKAIWEDYETETSGGQFKVNIMLSVSEAEAARTSEKIKSVMDYKRQHGEHLGPVPIGYRLVDKKLVIDPNTEAIVRKIFEMHDLGQGCLAIRRYLSSVGHDMRSSNVCRLIYSPVYAGDDNGSPCPAYFSQEEYQRRCTARRIRDTRSDHKETYLFSGLLRCKICGAKMRSLNRKVNGVTYINYVCRVESQKFIHPGFSIAERKLESALLASLQDLSDAYNLKAESDVRKQGERERDLASLNARLRRIGDRYEDGDIAKDEYRKKRDEIKAKIAALKVIPSAKKLLLPDSFAKTYVQLERDGKKAFWCSLLVAVTIDPEHKCDFDIGDIFWR